MKTLIPIELVERKIYLIRDQKVMLDRDLALLYEVETRALNQAVRRNIDRFPEDFVFALTREEIMRISQIVISSPAGKETLKFSNNVLAFTEQGVAMLSGVLKSKRAVQVNVAIMRAFVKLREMISSNKELAKKLLELEKKYDMQFKAVFDAIRELMKHPVPKEKRVGFIVKESKARYRTTRR